MKSPREAPGLLRLRTIILLLAGGCAVGTLATGARAEAGGRRGSLQVTSFPAGATVSAGLFGVATTPAEFPSLPVGRHKVVITLPDYLPRTLLVEIQPGQTSYETIHLDLDPGPAGRVRSRGISVWVEAAEAGRYDRIKDALEHAPEGAELRFDPGQYEGPVTVARSLRMTAGSATGGVFLVAADEPCLTVTGGDLQCRGLTFSRIRKGEPSGPAVHVRGGRAAFDGCQILSESLAALVVAGASSRADLAGCYVQSALGNGLLFADGASGRVTKTSIVGCGGCGVEAVGGARPEVSHCRVLDSGQSGVLVHGGAEGIFEDCEIGYSQRAGIEVRSGGRPLVRRVALREGNAGGVFVHDQGQGRFEDCEITGSARAGVETRSGGNPQIVRCQVRFSEQAGVLAHDRGSGEFEDCVFIGQRFAGVEIRDRAAPSFRNCRIEGGLSAGLLADDFAGGEFHNCEIRGNRLAGVEIAAGSHPRLSNCVVEEGAKAGVLVYAGGRGRLDGCDIRANLRDGVEVREASHLVVNGGAIVANGRYGVVIHAGATATLHRVAIGTNRLGAVSAQPGSGLLGDWAPGVVRTP